MTRWITQLLRSFKWVQQARSVALQHNRARAEQGQPQAQYDLGERYHDGLGVTRDVAQAFAWFLQAARQGHARAQTNVGLMLLLGRGTNADPVEGCRWLERAAAQGEPKAAAALDRARQRLSPAQLAELRRPSEDA